MKIKVKLAKKENINVEITTDFIRLDSALKLGNVVSTGGQAKMLILDGLIRVNGEKCLSRGKKLFPGDNFEYKSTTYSIIEAVKS